MAVREGEETDDEIKRCPCGEIRPAVCYEWRGNVRVYKVECADAGCWIGPRAPTREKAIKLWNARG